MKSIYFKFAAALVLLMQALQLFSQSSVPVVNEFNTAISGNQTLQARHKIVLNPGFSYTPAGGTFKTQFVDPVVSGTVDLSTPQDVLSSRAVSTTLTPGTLPGGVDVTQVGSAGYTIPIEVPKGVDGFQPSLAISYSSMAGDGMLGTGWNIAGLGAITRVPANQYFDNLFDPVDFDALDRFALNGQRMILINGTYGATGSEYRLEQDQSVKITYNNGYFIVKTGDGLTFEYGATSDSRIAGNSSNTLSWLVNKITNNYSQVIGVSYITEAGNAYPQKIVYGTSRIEFLYKNRVIPLRSYFQGNTFFQSYLMDKIQVYNNQTLYGEYGFNYFKATVTEAPLLREITRTGRNGELINPTFFSYEILKPLVETHTVKEHQYISYKSKHYVGDFNGDGRKDFLCVPNSANGGTGTVWRIFNSSNNDLFNAGPTMDPAINLANLNDLICMDINADGKDDIVYEKSVTSGNTRTSTLYYIKNNGTSFSSPIKLMHTVSDQFTGFFEKLFRSSERLRDNVRQSARDFNGDGINDLLVTGKDGFWKLYSMKNRTTMDSLGWGTIPGLSDMILTGDFDGDGLADMWNFKDDGVDIYSLSGSSFVKKHNLGAITKKHLFAPGDYNGDGKLDLLVYGYNNNDTKQDYADWKIYLSTGANFEVYTFGQLKQDLFKDDISMGDFNGDGKTDLMVSSKDGSWAGATFYTARCNGYGFNSQQLVNIFDHHSYLNIADFNGDGRTDLIYMDNVVSYWLGYETVKFEGSNQDRLAEVSNGLGHYSKISYVPLSHQSAATVYTPGAASAYPLQTFQGPLNVVSQIEVGNGIGGSQVVKYAYEGAKIHQQGKGFLGFSKVTTQNEATGISTENTYAINTTYYYPQLTSAITKHKTDGQIQSVSNTWLHKTFGTSKRFIPYVDSSTTTNHLTGFTASTTMTIDDYGNMLSSSTSYGVGAPTHKKTVSYNYDLTNWLLGRPSNVTETQEQTGLATISKQFALFYEAGKVKLDIIRCYAGGSNVWQKNYDYNSNGTLAAFHDASAGLGEKKTYYYYDTNGIHLERQIAPDGLTTKYSYHPGTDWVHKITDHWNNVTTMLYDDLGNTTNTTQTNGIGTSTKLAWVTNGTPTNARYSVTQTGTDGSLAIAYYDVLGREIRRGAKNFDGTMAYTQTDYNAKGQVHRVSEPFASTPSLWNTTSYYDDGRIAVVANTVGGTFQYVYSNGTTWGINNFANSSFITNATDATGWIKTRDDAGGTIKYEYRPDGKVTKITAPGDVVTTMTYDPQGNQLSLVDPSAGTTTYTYYGAGELKTQVTPKGTTTYYYLTDGRMDYYTTPEGTVDYTYGTNKLLASITSPGGVSRSYAHDSSGRVDEISETIEAGQTNKVKFAYDNLGRVSSKTYTNSNNVSYVESYVYNSYGFLDQVKFNNTVVYDVSTMDTRGNITQASIGGTNSTWGYDPYGLLTSITATGVQNYTFEFERNMGNLLTRSNVLKSKSEDFGYDKADRLLDVYHNDISAQSIDYDEKGNIVSKSDAGTLVYDNGSPYQLAHVTPYTANFPSGEQVATYTSYGQVNTITDGAYGATFKYNSDKQRVKMTYTQNGSVTKTKYYFGSSYEKEVSGTIPTEYIWIGGDAYTAVAVAKIVNNGTPQVWSIFRDHLGSITHVKNGSTVQEYSYDAWGRRRNPTSWDYNLSGQPALIADRGFTGHEHLTEFGLINMNGRLYDPLVGRFLSPDNYVQDASNSQNFNRYGYCLNNPLRYTDPDGELIWIIPNIGWSKEGGFSIGLSVVLGIPGGLSAQAGFGYNFGSNDAYGYVGATAAMNTVSASYSSNSGGSIGYTAGTSPFSGLPISTNFGTIGVNYNITHNSMSGNISAWQLDQNGWTFNPSVSVMVFPEQTTNLVRGQGFRNNDAVLSRFVAAGNHKGALDYFGFEGSYVAEDGVGSFWFNNNDPSKCGIRYRNNDFDSYGSLYSTYIKESFHMKRFEKGSFELGNSGVFSVDRWPEERQGIIRQYKTSGLHGDKTNFLKSIGNAENKINTYNTYGDYNPVYQFQSYTPRWWHLIYKIPRRW